MGATGRPLSFTFTLSPIYCNVKELQIEGGLAVNARPPSGLKGNCNDPRFHTSFHHLVCWQLH